MSIQIDIDYSQMLEAGNGLPGGPGDSPVFEAEFATLSGQMFSFFAVSIVNRHAKQYSFPFLVQKFLEIHEYTLKIQVWLSQKKIKK